MKISVSNMQMKSQNWIWMVMQSAGWRLVNRMKRCIAFWDAVVPHLPDNKPTYLMGVGTPANILEAVDRGVDFFDCVYPAETEDMDTCTQTMGN